MSKAMAKRQAWRRGRLVLRGPLFGRNVYPPSYRRIAVRWCPQPK